VSKALDFGVQSYCFREFKDNQVVAQKVKQIGVNKIEVCAAHANLDDPAGFRSVVQTYKDAGVEVISIGVQTFKGADNEKNWFECAKVGGFKHISAHFTVDTFQTVVPKVAKTAEQFDIRIGIHCHGGYMFGGQPDVINHLMQLGGERIGVCIDTAWAMQIGPRQGDALKWVERFKGRIYGVHYKDFVFERNAQWKDVVVGTGNLNLAAFVQALNDSGFDGMAVIEYEADPKDPTPALTECVKKMRELAK
jgi:sugar phosphate isomerase/epimerase